MTHTFLTISDAVKRTGRSASTIRRLVHTISEDDHPDRSGLEPDLKQVAALKKKGENFTWRIREDILMKHFKGALKEEKNSASASSQGILQILEKELELKNHQIEKQWEVIHALNDRLREGNILMGSLQKRLALPSPELSSETVVEASSVTPSKEPATATSKKSVKPSRRKLFRWFSR